MYMGHVKLKQITNYNKNYYRRVIKEQNVLNFSSMYYVYKKIKLEELRGHKVVSNVAKI